MSLVDKSHKKTVTPMNGTKELADSNHKLKGVVGNVILYFELRMVSQTNTCMPGKKELVGSGGDSRRELME